MPGDLLGFEAGLFECESVCAIADRADLGVVEPVVGDNGRGVAQIAVALTRTLDNPKGFQVSRLGRRCWAAVLDKLRRPPLAVVAAGSHWCGR